MEADSPPKGGNHLIYINNLIEPRAPLLALAVIGVLFLAKPWRAPHREELQKAGKDNEKDD